MVAIDTSALVRYLVQDDKKLAAEASRVIKNLRAGEAALDRLILAETGYVLRSVYGFSKKDITEVYFALLADSRFTVTDRELTELAVELFSTERPLSFEDSWLLALKNAGKVSKVLTFDKDLIKRL